MRLDPQQTYVHLDSNGTATSLPGGAAFWSRPEAELERFGQDWLVSEFSFEEDWSNWEMHPHADEFVYLLSGAVDVVLETASGIENVALEGSGAVVVPRGVWHTAKVHAPSRMLHITMGAGTMHRPVAAT